MPERPHVFYAGPNAIPYEFGVAAAGDVQYLRADVVLTGSLVRQFAFNAKKNVPYDFEALLLLFVTGAGAVTVQAGITDGTSNIALQQIVNTTGTTLEIKQNSSTSGAVSLASSSLATGFRSMSIRGSAWKTTADGVLFLDISTAGTVSLEDGSTFKVFRTEL